MRGEVGPVEVDGVAGAAGEVEEGLRDLPAGDGSVRPVGLGMGAAARNPNTTAPRTFYYAPTLGPRSAMVDSQLA